MACEEIFELSSTGMYSRDDNSYNDFYTTKILLDLMKRTGYPVIHEPGQRVFGPPPDWNGPPPDRDSEVFIGKLPKDCFEHEILEFVLKIGPVYKIRLMTNCNGTTRGFAFVTFQSITDAEKAVKELNDTCLIRRPGVRIGVSASINNTRLIVYNMCEYFPETSFKKSIFAVLGKLNISVRALKTGTMGWLEFDSHKEAALARKELRNVSRRWLGDCAWVDWAPPVLPDYTAKNLEYNDQAQISTMLRREISLSQNTTNDIRAIKGVASAMPPHLHQFFDQNDLPQFSENLFKISDSNIYHFDFELTDANNNGNNNSIGAISLKHKNKSLYETDLFYFKSIASSSSISSPTSSSAFSLPVETVSSNLPITSSRISCGLITLDSPDLPIPVDNKCKQKIDKDENSNSNTLDILLAEKNSSLLWSHNLPQFDYFPPKKQQYSSDGINYNYIECLRKITNYNNFSLDKPIYGNKHYYEIIYQQPNIDVIQLASGLSVQRSMKFFKNNSSH